MYSQENACKVQVDALASGQELYYTKDSAARALGMHGKVKEKPGFSARASWEAAVRRLDAEDQSYRQ